jgi:hypothetical protein
MRTGRAYSTVENLGALCPPDTYSSRLMSDFKLRFRMSRCKYLGWIPNRRAVWTGLPFASSSAVSTICCFVWFRVSLLQDRVGQVFGKKFVGQSHHDGLFESRYLTRVRRPAR